jgi:hypothetical protein
MESGPRPGNIFEAMGAQNRAEKKEETPEFDAFLELAKSAKVMAQFEELKDMFKTAELQSDASFLKTTNLKVNDTIPSAISEAFDDSTIYKEHSIDGIRMYTDSGIYNLESGEVPSILKEYGRSRTAGTFDIKRNEIPYTRADFDKVMKQLYGEFTSDPNRYQTNEKGEVVFDDIFIQQFTEVVQFLHTYFEKRLASFKNVRSAETVPSAFFDAHPEARDSFSQADQVRIVDTEALYDEGEDDIATALAIRNGVPIKEVRAYIARLDGMPDEQQQEFGVNNKEYNRGMYNISNALASLTEFAIIQNGGNIGKSKLSVRELIESKEYFEFILSEVIVPLQHSKNDRTADDVIKRERAQLKVDEHLERFLGEYHQLVKDIDLEIKKMGELRKKRRSK